jgi:Flp pilus assembly protein TadB
MTFLSVLFFINVIFCLVTGLVLFKRHISQGGDVSIVSLPSFTLDTVNYKNNSQSLHTKLFHRRSSTIPIEEWCRFFDLIGFSLKSGLTLRQACESVSPHIDGLQKKGVEQLLQDMTLGLSFVNALCRWQDTLHDPLLKRFIFIVELHETTGGDIIHLLQKWTHQLRQYQQIQIHIEQSTKEARASGVILSLLTPLIALLTWYLHQDLWLKALHSHLGLSLFIATLLLWLSGVVWTRYLTNIKAGDDD